MGDDNLNLLELGRAVDLEAASWPLSFDPREGEETEVTERGGGGGGETKRALSATLALDPRDGEDTEEVQEGDAKQAFS
jgi:hypothetical protein